MESKAKLLEKTLLPYLPNHGELLEKQAPP